VPTDAVIGVPGGIKPSVLALVDPAEHALRRRLWDRAFTPSQLKHYEPLLKKRVAQLVSCLRAREGQTLDLAEWLMYMTLDYLGDFATGGLMNFMEAGGDATGVTKMAARYISVAEALGTIPWSRIFLRTLPAAKSPLRMMAAEVLQRRRKTPSNIRDLFYYLVSCDLLAIFSAAKRVHSSTRAGRADTSHLTNRPWLWRHPSRLLQGQTLQQLRWPTRCST
jgi:cytochrome P450